MSAFASKFRLLQTLIPRTSQTTISKAVSLQLDGPKFSVYPEIEKSGFFYNDAGLLLPLQFQNYNQISNVLSKDLMQIMGVLSAAGIDNAILKNIETDSENLPRVSRGALLHWLQLEGLEYINKPRSVLVLQKKVDWEYGRIEPEDNLDDVGPCLSVENDAFKY